MRIELASSARTVSSFQEQCVVVVESNLLFGNGSNAGFVDHEQCLVVE